MKVMKNIMLSLAILLSINSFAQTDRHLMSDEDVDMILDTNYIFFAYKDTVFSTEGCIMPFSGIVTIAEYLRNDKSITPSEANKAFKYIADWWNYSDEFGGELPQKPDLLQTTYSKLKQNTQFEEIVDAIKTLHYEIPNVRYLNRILKNTP
jgi:hypothetical protein